MERSRLELEQAVKEKDSMIAAKDKEISQVSVACSLLQQFLLRIVCVVPVGVLSPTTRHMRQCIKTVYTGVLHVKLIPAAPSPGVLS